MKCIAGIAQVSQDHRLRLELTVGPDVQPGTHPVVIMFDNARSVATAAGGPLNLPVHDVGPWPENLSLRREDLYGDSVR